jgi:uncharacterized protein YjbI with pentapeptide repeats
VTNDSKRDSIRKQLNFRPTTGGKSWVEERGLEVQAYCQQLLEEAKRFQVFEPPAWFAHSLDEQALKTQLINVLQKEQANIVKEAVYELQRRGWLQDGSLRGVSLVGANLAGVVFVNADMGGANMMDASLEGAYFIRTNLAGVNFANAHLTNCVIEDSDMTAASFENADLRWCWIGTKLSRASLNKVNLEKGVIVSADLTGATFVEANLKEAWLFEPTMYGVDLYRANLYRTVFIIPRVDAYIRLPDGTILQPFNFKRQLHHYADPKNPLFWPKPEVPNE